jgi:hypothetical protein
VDVNASRLSTSPFAPAVCCQVSAWAGVRMTAEELPLWQRQSVAAAWPGLPSSLLKHAEPQTIAGLVAVRQAMHQHELTGVCFRDWGAIAGPSFLGRQASADAIQRFREEGAFAVSPHLIPHKSLHAVSGTLSQALALQGPNFGVGGGPGAAEEALLVAATLLAEPIVPGIWVVLTEFDPEFIPVSAGHNGIGAASWICHAVALALAPTAAAMTPKGLRLHVGMNSPPAEESALEQFRLADLTTAIANGVDAARGWRCRNYGWISLSQGDCGHADYGHADYGRAPYGRAYGGRADNRHADNRHADNGAGELR